MTHETETELWRELKEATEAQEIIRIVMQIAEMNCIHNPAMYAVGYLASQLSGERLDRNNV